MVSKPARIRVRMYQVGFGDCFLVSLEYDEKLADGRAERHVLIDFGGDADARLADVAKLIAEHTSGRLDVLVVSQRHADHTAGFGVAGAVLHKLAPARVLRPWPDDPRLRTEPEAAAAPEASAQYARMLSHAQSAASTLPAVDALQRDVQGDARRQAASADIESVLEELGADGRVRYLAAGGDAQTDAVVPGLDVTVLGPATLEQRARRTKSGGGSRRTAALHASLVEASAGRTSEPIQFGPGPVRWLVARLAAQRSHSVARLVRDLDDAINDTSLMLLLEVGGVSLLFGGDAQAEGWQPILDRARRDAGLRSALANVDLYKVGQHGSRSATPRSLYALWIERDEPLTVLLSTRSGLHGTTEATAIPRASLVRALGEVGTLHSTDELDAPFVEVVADAAAGPFRVVEP